MTARNEWIHELNAAIDDLEARKKLLMKSCVTCWDPSIDWALDALKIIRKLLMIHASLGMVNDLERLILTMHYGKKEHYKEENND